MPGSHVFLKIYRKKAWMAGTSGAKKRGAFHWAALGENPLALFPGHDD
jgi:hypothetical protein